MNQVINIEKMFGIAEELKTRKERREYIIRLQNIMSDFPDEAKIDFPVTHNFAPGAYARDCFLPIGTLVVGKIHKTEHLNIVNGTCLVATEEGVCKIEGPFTYTSKAGIQKVVWALTDVYWTTIHLTESTDIEEIESQVIAKDYSEIPLLEEL